MNFTFADGSIEQYEDTPLSAGLEGKIYRSRDGKSAVKLYHPPDPARDSERIARIDKLINNFNPTKDDPYWVQYFAWPEKRVMVPQVGFRMPFVGGLKTVENYFLKKPYGMLKPEDRGWFIGRIAVAIKLVTAANRLSSMGLCYPDFSGKNILVDPFDGRMVLIDCDSLTVPGKLSPTVEGTSSFRAPEIISRAVSVPSVLTDRHALAVILYRWLLLWHPLVGDKKFDLNNIDRDDELRYGQQALYIEHPTDTTNRASGQTLKARVLGHELEKLFQVAFVDGLHKPDERPLPFQWLQALYHTYDQIIPCASRSCDWRFFVASPAPRLTCPRCHEPLRNPQTLPFVYLLRHKGTKNPDDYPTDTSIAHFVVGWPGRSLYCWHARPGATPIYTDAAHVPDATPCAVFEYDQRTKQWYLKNLTLPDMLYKVPFDSAGAWIPCPPNSDIPLASGILIQFGKAPAYFRARVIVAKVG
jgi:DNA-binding helix-hairpin-helix protein with protein kinase domain